MSVAWQNRKDPEDLYMQWSWEKSQDLYLFPPPVTDIHLPGTPCKHMLSWSEELSAQAAHLFRSIWPRAGQEKKNGKREAIQWLFKNKFLCFPQSHATASQGGASSGDGGMHLLLYCCLNRPSLKWRCHEQNVWLSKLLSLNPGLDVNKELHNALNSLERNEVTNSA